VTGAIAVRPHESMRLRGLVHGITFLAPALPISQWVAQWTWSRNSPNFSSQADYS